jgi:hypothetical protein
MGPQKSKKETRKAKTDSIKRSAVRAAEAGATMGASELIRAFPKTASKVGLKKSKLASERYNRYQQKSKVKRKRK